MPSRDRGREKETKVIKHPPISQPEVERYEGNKFLFRRHGNGRAKHKGGLTYKGNWSGGRWHGEGDLSKAGVWTYLGRFKKGMLHGPGELTACGRWTFSGKFRASEPRGKGILKLDNGASFTGKWYDSENAQGKFTDADGSVTKAKIVDGELVTKGGFFSKWKPVEKTGFRALFRS